MSRNREMRLTAVLGLLLLISAAPVMAQETIYSSIPTPYPGSFQSLGFQATGTDQIGDHIQFGGIERDLGTVVVSLTSWACENDFMLDENGNWIPDRDGQAGEACVSSQDSGFDHPVTINIYEVDNSGLNPAVGALLASKTVTFFIPFRPSWDSVNCTASGDTPGTNLPHGGKWFDPVLGFCVNGFAFNIEFDFAAHGIVLPEEVIYGVAMNTGSHGEMPIGSAGPYNSLNASFDALPASVGLNVEPATLFWDTSIAGFYCDSGSGGVDTFRRDADCWGTFTPIVEFIAGLPEPPLPVPADNDACKDGGWLSLFRADGTPFKNQGDCIQYVNTGK